MPSRPPPAPPTYFGEHLVSADLPAEAEPWPGPDRLAVGPDPNDLEMTRGEVRRYIGGKPWIWPSRPVFFLCDIHADPDAFLSSLVASGGVEKTGKGPDEYRLTEEGRQGVFVIGGDCFDKGPTNLGLLGAIKRFIDTGAEVELLAGNHDLRTVLGIAYTGSKDPRYAHLFVRMGRKSIRLLQEVYEAYGLDDGNPSEADEARARARLYPGDEWFDEFPKVTEGLIPRKQLAKELGRIREKQSALLEKAKAVGMTLTGLEMAVNKCRELFLEPEGEYAWFFKRMTLAWRAGSFLFIHAGVDDETAALLRDRGVEGLNDTFRQMFEEDLFTLYHGPLGSGFRTKYRDVDFPFTDEGVQSMRNAGIYAIVHGHRALKYGQRIMLRRALMNFECDCSVDANTRKVDELKGSGGAATVFRPDCTVVAVSTDRRKARVFDPAHLSDGVAIMQDLDNFEEPRVRVVSRHG